MAETKDENRQVIFCFLNGSTLTIEFPRVAGNDAITSISNLRKALDTERIVIEADGDLMVIPVENLAWFRVHPAPDGLPTGIIRNAHIVSEGMVRK